MTGRIPGADFSLRRLITALFWVEVLGNVKVAGTSCSLGCLSVCQLRVRITSLTEQTKVDLCGLTKMV